MSEAGPPVPGVDLLLGRMARNIFDLGATATAALFKDATVDFHAVRDRLRPRPWPRAH